MIDERAARHKPGYQVFMLALCLYAIGVLAFQAAATTDPSTAAILDYADFGVCLIFLADFAISLWRADNRWRYFITWGWLDLLSSIPTLDIARWGRAARILRVFRLLRGLRATKLVANVVMRDRAQNAILAAALIALMLITFSSIAILHFEAGPNGNITTASDAVWWAFTTITTVGYGDRYPITSEGRMVAIVLMSAGVGLFGAFSGFLASWFVGPEVEESSEKELAAIRLEIAALRESIERGQLSESRKIAPQA